MMSMIVLTQEGLLKKLREAAIKSDVPATKDAIGKAKAHGAPWQNPMVPFRQLSSLS